MWSLALFSLLSIFHSFYFSVFSVYTYKNHFFHHLTKWTETFATRHSGISLSTNYLQYSEEQFNLRHLRKPQLSLHLVVVALSPVEQRQSLCTKDLMSFFFSRPCINSLAKSFYLRHMPDNVILKYWTLPMQKFWSSLLSGYMPGWPLERSTVDLRTTGKQSQKNCAGMSKQK